MVLGGYCQTFFKFSLNLRLHRPQSLKRDWPLIDVLVFTSKIVLTSKITTTSTSQYVLRFVRGMYLCIYVCCTYNVCMYSIVLTIIIAEYGVWSVAAWVYDSIIYSGVNKRGRDVYCIVGVLGKSSHTL